MPDLNTYRAARRKFSSEPATDSQGPIRQVEARRKADAMNPPRRPWATVLWSWLPPVVAFAACRVLVTAQAGQGLFTFSPNSWSRWDSINYASIAKKGYTFYRCTPNSNGQKWCGNAGWFPGYPVLLHVVKAAGLPLAAGGAFLSSVFLLVAFAVLWIGFLRDLPRWRATGLLALAAAFPGVVYGFAVFPMSMELLGVSVMFVALQRRRRVVAVLAAAVAVAAYPEAAVLVGILGLSYALAERRSVAEVARRMALAAIAALPLLALVIWDAVNLHHWNAYSLEANPNQRLIHDPLAALWYLAVRHAGVWSRNAVLLRWVGWQAAVTAVIFAAAALSVVLGLLQNRRGAMAVEMTMLGAVLAMWVFSLMTVSKSGPYRGVLGLMPVVVLLRRAPAPAVWAGAVICAVVTYNVSGFFFSSGLV
jgi:hypothetical protein